LVAAKRENGGMARLLFGLLTAIVCAIVIHAPCAAAQAADAPAVSASAPNPDARVEVPEPSALAVQFYRTGNYIWLFIQLWSLAIPALFLFTGLSAKIRDWAKGIGRWWYPTIALYIIIFFIIMYIIELPLDYYRGFIRQHAYGLSNQTFAKWMQDSLTTLGITLVGSALFLWVPYLLLRASPKRWWLYTSLLVIPFIFFMAMIFPVFIDPLFNKFQPMQNKDLEAKVLALADRAGIEGSRVFEVDKSVDTKQLNAYVTGFLNTKRVVLWDTTLEKMTEQEILSVVGHEMGHYVMNHVVWGVLLSSLLTCLSLYIIHRASGWMIRKWSGRFGFTELSDIASFPLILLFMAAIGLVVSPVSNIVSRHFEHESDRFALEIYKDNQAMATAFIKLQQENLAVPRPGMLYKIWRSSHPPLGERIDFANDYKPWKEGKSLKYENLFH
jgi:STE24 endopeptidase